MMMGGAGQAELRPDFSSDPLPCQLGLWGRWLFCPKPQCVLLDKWGLMRTNADHLPLTPWGGGLGRPYKQAMAQSASELEVRLGQGRVGSHCGLCSRRLPPPSCHKRNPAWGPAGFLEVSEHKLCQGISRFLPARREHVVCVHVSMCTYVHAFSCTQ